MAAATREKILEQLDRLSAQEQEQVLSFATSIVQQRHIGVPGKELLRFAGTISEEDADTMMRIIDEDCGRVDPNEW